MQDHRARTDQVPRSRRKPGLERLQVHADELFYRQGLSTGVEAILGAAQVARGTLYNNLDGKAALIALYLDRRHEAALALFDEATSGTSCPTEAVCAVFSALAERAREPGYRGCAFILAAAEDPVVAGPRARAHKLAVRDRFARLCEGHVDDAAEVAEQLMLLYDGCLVATTVRDSSVNQAPRAQDAATLLLRHHDTRH